MACISLYGVLNVKIVIAAHRVLRKPLQYNRPCLEDSGQQLQVGCNHRYQWHDRNGAAPGDTNTSPPEQADVYDQGISHGTLPQDYNTKM